MVSKMNFICTLPFANTEGWDKLWAYLTVFFGLSGILWNMSVDDTGIHVKFKSQEDQVKFILNWM